MLTLDDGRGRGVRVADFNTGSGLRFRVVIDRAMDISDAFYNAYSLAWISRNGVSRPETRAGMNWLGGFGGGLLTTCGLDHVGGPESDGFGARCLHGDIGNISAELECVKQPDIAKENATMSVSGRILQSTVFGPHIELRRTVFSILGVPKIAVRDEVTNLGNEKVPHMVLYHINLGWPLIDKETRLLWKGDWTSGKPNDPIVNARNDFTVCRAPMKEHSGSGESVIFIDSAADSDGFCRCEARNDPLGLGLKIRFDKTMLPWLINWQHWGEGEYVTALEPATNPPIGQSAARAAKTLRFIEPGETLVYELEFEAAKY